MSLHEFGAARRGIPAGYGEFSIELGVLRCPNCDSEYLAWGDRGATENEKNEAIKLLTRFIAKRHPEHTADRYGAMTLEDLRTQTFYP